MEAARGTGRPAARLREVVAAVPLPCALLDPDLVVLEVSHALTTLTGRPHEVWRGAPLAGAAMLPGEDVLRAALRAAVSTGAPSALPAQTGGPAGRAGSDRGGVLDDGAAARGGPEGRDGQAGDVGGAVDDGARWWNVVAAPVLDRDGAVGAVLLVLEDISGVVREHPAGDVVVPTATSLLSTPTPERAGTGAAGRLWRLATGGRSGRGQRAERVRALLVAQQEAALRLAGLAHVALALVEAEGVPDVATVVAEQGLASLGCGGAGLVVLDPEDPSALLSYVTTSHGRGVVQDVERLALDTALPACEVARTGRAVLLPDRRTSLAYSPLMARVEADSGSQAWAYLPLLSGGRTVGVLFAGWDEPREFTGEDVAVLEAFAAQCAQTLERVAALDAERQAAAAVARMSERLQRSLLTDVPQPDHLQLVSRYVPAAQQAQVGGDWYDAFLVPDGSTCLVIGDVSGHDSEAAVAMAQVRNVLRGVAQVVAEPPGLVLAALDRAMRDLAVGALATAVLARVEQDEGDRATDHRVLRWSNAGHPPPLLIEPGGRAELLRGGRGRSTDPDLLLGLLADSARHDHERVLVPGATVVLYTDGLVERRGEDLDVGLARLRDAGERLGSLELDELCDALLREVGPGGAHRGEDDVALLALRAHTETRERPAAAGPRTLPADLRRARER